MQHITKKRIEDKIMLFALAGIAKNNGNGWDYAIPQQWFDQLINMGIESPVQWFAADCTGPAAFPVLHHVGEAFVKILHHRSEDNGKLWIEITNEALGLDAPSKYDDVCAYLLDNQATMDEADAGFTNLHLIVHAYDEGMKRGRQHTRFEEKNFLHPIIDMLSNQPTPENISIAIAKLTDLTK